MKNKLTILIAALLLFGFAGCGSSNSKVPANNESGTNSNGGNPDSNGGNPDSNGGNPDSEDANPDSEDANPDIEDANPDSNGGKPDSNGGKPDSNGGKPDSNGGGTNFNKTPCEIDPNSVSCACDNDPNSQDCICGETLDSSGKIKKSTSLNTKRACFCWYPENKTDPTCQPPPLNILCTNYCGAANDEKKKEYFDKLNSFYPDRDCDGDGIPDCQEISCDTSNSPVDPDSMTNPCNTDSDGDKIMDRDEKINGTNPMKADSDGDGLSDGDELKFGMNPANSHSQGDKFPKDEDQWVVKACDTIKALDSLNIKKNTDGDWKFAVPNAAVYSNLTINKVYPQGVRKEGAAIIKNTVQNVYAGIFSMGTDGTSISDTDSAMKYFADKFTHNNKLGITHSYIGATAPTHDLYEFAHAKFEVTHAPITTENLRNELMLLLSGLKKSEIDGLESISQEKKTKFFISISATLRKETGNKERIIVSFAVTPIDHITIRSDGSNQLNATRVKNTVEDLSNTTSVSRITDQEGSICVNFVANKVQPKVEFYFVLDESGSMITANTIMRSFANDFWKSLENVDLDYRVGVTNIEPNNSDSVKSVDKDCNGMPLVVDGSEGWTKNKETFSKEVSNIIEGNGNNECGLYMAMNGLRCMTKSMTAKTETTWDSPKHYNIVDSRRKVRRDAKVVITWFTDEDDSCPRYGYAEKAIKAFKDKYIAFAIVTEDRFAYVNVALATGGAYTTFKKEDDAGNKIRLGKMIDDIINAASGFASPYKLPVSPITSSMQVYMQHPTEHYGAVLQRSKVNGFSYDSQNNSIGFFGDARPKMQSTTADSSYQFPDQIIVNYHYFEIKRKPELSSNTD